LLKLANEHLEKNNCDAAISYFDQYLKKDPTNLDVHYKRGVCLIKTKQFEKAKSDFLLLEKNKFIEGDVNFHLALVYIMFEDYELAETYINKQIAKNDILKCHYIKATILLAENKNQAALDEFNYFINVETNFSDAYAYRALCFIYMNEFALAKMDLKKSLSMSTTPDNQYVMGCFNYYVELNYSEALKYFQNAIQMNYPLKDIKVYELACQIHLGNVQVEDDLKTLIETNYKSCAVIGQAYMGAENYIKAEYYLSKAIQLNYKTAGIYLLLAACQMDLNPNNCEAFISNIEKSWELDSS
jgi:tetratricopeptide (TPR) repeat protein